jgi:superfamily II DNA/RNA helicase
VGTRAAASNQAQQQQQQQQQQDQALTAEDAFYAEAVQSFADLGIAPTIVDAMQTAGFTKPSRVQVSLSTAVASHTA